MTKQLTRQTDLATIELEARRMRAEILTSGLRHLRDQVRGALTRHRSELA